MGRGLLERFVGSVVLGDVRADLMFFGLGCTIVAFDDGNAIVGWTLMTLLHAGVLCMCSLQESFPRE